MKERHVTTNTEKIGLDTTEIGLEKVKLELVCWYTPAFGGEPRIIDGLLVLYRGHDVTEIFNKESIVTIEEHIFEWLEGDDE